MFQIVLSVDHPEHPGDNRYAVNVVYEITRSDTGFYVTTQDGEIIGRHPTFPAAHAALKSLIKEA